VDSIFVLIGTSILIFLLLYLTPGDPAQLLLADTAAPQEVEEMRAKMGLDKPLPVQYVIFLKNALRGDLGTSFRYNRSAMSVVLSFLPATVELSLAAIVIAVLVAIPLGVLAATHQSSWIDNIAMFFSMVGQSAPTYWLGLMLIVVFSLKLGLLPTSGRGGLSFIVLPGLTLSTWLIGLVTRLTRSTMLEILEQDYIRTARAKGLLNLKVVYKHALKNALIPIVTILGLQVGTLLGGAVITETVFAWPGIGTLAMNAIFTRDFPLIRAIVLVSALIFVVVNIVVDLLYLYLDPRIRYE
jgi:ABC-type dipeptide/oligopeptide/nickel transport system permease component